MSKRTLELLSPAKDADTAKTAILAGADSVYIGASNFGARAAAGNSTDSIARLCDFAHTYGCKIYITINTILTDEELSQACELIDELYEAGADAIIVQDMGLIAKCKSPIAFHASTQCHLTTPEKAQFLSSCGFETLVLARELSLSEIKKISSQVNNRLECFIHGALCVSYSGQCYLSATIGGRSGNRGVCAQPCRMKYDFVDSNGKQIAPSAHYLSLRDMNRSEHLEQMIDAGVSVFKIEGRLKNADYVKNITAFYRQKLDKIISANPEKYARSSFGETTIDFNPSPQKTFSRTFTEYHLNGISKGNECFSTPKARGEYIGEITKTFSNGFFFQNAEKIFSNGDGIFIEGASQLGANIQKVEHDKVFLGSPTEKIHVEKGSLWRNKDIAFERALQKPTTRKMPILISIEETSDYWQIKASTNDSRSISTEITLEKSSVEISKNTEASKALLTQNLAKTGATEFSATTSISAQTLPFLKASQINEIRRTLLDNLRKNILHSYEINRRKYQRPKPKKKQFTLPPFSTDKYANVYNKSAMQFYNEMGFDISEYAPENLPTMQGVRVMNTRHCILRELDLCKKNGGTKKFKEPFYLKNSECSLQLNFDCSNCGMNILYDGHR